LLVNEERRAVMVVLERVQSLRESLSVEDFCSLLKDRGILRAYIVYQDGKFRLSHPEILEPLQIFLESSPDFASHEAIFIGREEGLGTVFFAFVHDTHRGPAQGGLRSRRYGSLGDVLSDGLRLSQGMTRKNALANLWWGGSKGVVPITPTIDNAAYLTPGTPERRRLFRAYGRFIASLNGICYTAEDVGTTTSDMNAILEVNRFITCVGEELGGSGNPSPHTAQGVRNCMRVAWKVLTGEDSLQGVRVAVQGAGNVGLALIRLLVADGAQVWVSDVREAALDSVREVSPQIHIVDPDSIYDVEVEIFAPCANGATVNAATIPRLRHGGVRLVCGAANNILEREEDAERLADLDILFVPDFVCNRLGIVNCANEPFGYLLKDIERALRRVAVDVREILVAAKRRGVSPLAEANDRADRKAVELHPIFGHRGRALIEQLLHSGWSSPVSLERPRRVESRPVAF
jgi:leucine dehydrogenase